MTKMSSHRNEGGKRQSGKAPRGWLSDLPKAAETIQMSICQLNMRGSKLGFKVAQGRFVFWIGWWVLTHSLRKKNYLSLRCWQISMAWMIPLWPILFLVNYFLFCFWDRDSPCSSGCPQTHRAMSALPPTCGCYRWAPSCPIPVTAN